MQINTTVAAPESVQVYPFVTNVTEPSSYVSPGMYTRTPNTTTTWSVIGPTNESCTVTGSAACGCTSHEINPMFGTPLISNAWSQTTPPPSSTTVSTPLISGAITDPCFTAQRAATTAGTITATEVSCSAVLSSRSLCYVLPPKIYGLVGGSQGVVNLAGADATATTVSVFQGSLVPIRVVFGYGEVLPLTAVILVTIPNELTPTGTTAAVQVDSGSVAFTSDPLTTFGRVLDTLPGSYNITAIYPGAGSTTVIEVSRVCVGCPAETPSTLMGAGVVQFLITNLLVGCIGGVSPGSPTTRVLTFSVSVKESSAPGSAVLGSITGITTPTNTFFLGFNTSVSVSALDEGLTGTFTVSFPSGRTSTGIRYSVFSNNGTYLWFGPSKPAQPNSVTLTGSNFANFVFTTLRDNDVNGGVTVRVNPIIDVSAYDTFEKWYYWRFPPSELGTLTAPPLACSRASVFIRNIDSSGPVISSMPSNVGEDDLPSSSGSFVVKLQSQPNDLVNVTAISSNLAKLSNCAETLTFSSSNWNSFQTFTLLPVNNNITDGDATVSVTVVTSSLDPRFHNTFAAQTVQVKDEDKVPEIDHNQNFPSNTNGFAVLSITGKYFDQGPPGARIINIGANYLCQPVSWTDTRFVCLTPPGVGSHNISLSVYNYGPTAPIVSRFVAPSGTPLPTRVNYNSPVITGFFPTSAPATGAAIITISGTNFDGATSLMPRSISIGGRVCNPIAWRSDHSGVTCTVPAGSGANHYVTVTVGGQNFQKPGFSYQAPIIYGVFPNRRPTAGGWPVNITGLNFGGVDTTINTKVHFTAGGITRECTSAKWVSDNQISCITPAGYGALWFVRASVDTLTGTSSSPVFTYESPVVTSVLPTRISTGSSQTVTLFGYNFGVGSPFPASSGITYGSSALGAVFPCLPGSSGWGLLDHSMTCQTSVGVGANLPFVVSVATLQSAPYLSATEPFGYEPPRVTHLNPASMLSQGLGLVTFYGSNFGTPSILQGSPILRISWGNTSASAITLSGACSGWGVHLGTQFVCQVPVHPVDALVVSMGPIIRGQSPAANETGTFTYLANWVNINPVAAVARPGRNITVSGSGFLLTSRFRCAFNFSGPAINAPVSYLESDIVSPISDNLLVCGQPVWLWTASATTLSVLDITRNVVLVPPAAANKRTFTMMAGWDSLSTSVAVAGVSAPISVLGGGFNTTETNYVCRFEVDMGAYRVPLLSPPAKVLSFNEIVCLVPAGLTNPVDDTFFSGGYRAFVTVPDPMVPGSFITFNTEVAENQIITLTMGAPISLQAPTCDPSTITAFSAVLRWSLPTRIEANGAPVTHHRLYINGQPLFTLPVSLYVTNTSLVYKVGDLYPDTLYEFQIGYANSFRGLSDITPGTLKLTIRTLRSPPILFGIQAPTGFMTGGARVTITGNQFGDSIADVTAVTIGGKECIDRSWVNGTIICTTPPGNAPGSTNVLVQTLNGTSKEVSETGAAIRLPGNTLFYVYLQSPIITSVNPTNCPIKGACTIRIAGLHFGGSAPELKDISLAGFKCTSLLFKSSTEIFCQTPIVTKSETGPVIVTTQDGGSNLPDLARVFTFSVPLLQSVSPQIIDTQGKTLVSLTGQYMGMTYNDIVSIKVGDEAVDLALLRYTSPASLAFVAPSVRLLGSLDIILTSQTGGVSQGKVSLIFTAVAPYTELPPFTTSVTPASVGLGKSYTITVYGSNFGADEGALRQVKVVGENCQPFRWISPSMLTCQTPPIEDNARGVISVTSLTGGPGNGGAQFSFLPPNPRVLDFKPTTSSAAGGAIITLRGLNFGIGRVTPTIYLGRVPCDSSVWESPSVIVCVTPTLVNLISNNVTNSSLTAATDGIPFTVDVAGLVSNASAPFRYGIECDPPCGWDAVCVPLTGACQCNRFYIGPPSCETSVISFDLINQGRLYEVEAPLAAAGAPQSPAGPLGGLLYGPTGVSVVLTTAPTAKVTVDVAISDLTQAVLASGSRGQTLTSLVFTAADFNVPQSVLVQSVLDGIRDGLSTVTMHIVQVSSKDPTFDGHPPKSQTLQVVDAAPVVLGIFPIISRPTGLNITIWGTNFDPTPTIYLKNSDGLTTRVDPSLVNAVIKMTNGTHFVYNARNGFITYTNPVASRVNRTALQASATSAATPASAATKRFPAGFLPDPFEWEVVEIVTFLPPSTLGYQEVVVSNLDSQNATISNVLFYTDDCIQEGFFGRGEACKPCPEGASCPGGRRLVPQAGFWIPSEDSGFVYPCNPAAACLGGPGSPCSPGYSGLYCSKCSKGNYKDAAKFCTPCPPQSLVGLLILASMTLWFSLGAAGWFLKNGENVARCALFVLSMQTFGAVGNMLGPTSPERVRRMFEFFKVFSGDYSFLKPECQRGGSSSTYLGDMFIQIFYNGLIGVVVVLGVPVVRRLHRVLCRNQSPEMLDRKAEFYQNRFLRMFTVWVTVIYYPITKVAFSTFACTPVTDQVTGKRKFLLYVDPSITCFKGAHRGIFFLGFLLFSFVSLGWPVSVIYKLVSSRNWLTLDVSLAESWGFIFSSYKRKYYLWYLFDLSSLFLMSVSDVLVRNPFKQTVILALAYGNNLLLLILFRPFSSKFEGLISGTVNLITLLAVGYNYYTSLPGANEDVISKWTTTLMLGVMVTFFTLIGALVYFILIRWERRRTVIGEDYFISAAINRGFDQSKVIGDWYIEQVAQGSDVLQDAEVSLPSSSASKALVEHSSAPGKSVKKRVLKDDFLDEALNNLAVLKGLKRMRSKAPFHGEMVTGDGEEGDGLLGGHSGRAGPADGEGGSSGVLDDAGDKSRTFREAGASAAANSASSFVGNLSSDLAEVGVVMKTKETTLADNFGAAASPSSFLSHAQKPNGLNRYGRAEVVENSEDGDFEHDVAPEEAGDGATAGLAFVNQQQAAIEALEEQAFGVFFDEPSAVEAAMIAWDKALIKMREHTPQMDAVTLSTHRIDVSDPLSAPPERIHDLNRQLVLRRLQVAMLRLAHVCPKFVLCLKTYNNNSRPDGAPYVPRAASTFRYIFPWAQSGGAGGSIADMLDAIVLEICAQARVNVVKRLAGGRPAIISDIMVKAYDGPLKRMLIIQFHS